MGVHLPLENVSLAILFSAPSSKIHLSLSNKTVLFANFDKEFTVHAHVEKYM